MASYCPRANRDYEVIHHPHYDYIKGLACNYCKYINNRLEFKRSHTSGLGRYNRMRGDMVKHIFKEHKDEIEKNLAGRVKRRVEI